MLLQLQTPNKFGSMININGRDSLRGIYNEDRQSSNEATPKTLPKSKGTGTQKRRLSLVDGKSRNNFFRYLSLISFFIAKFVARNFFLLRKVPKKMPKKRKQFSTFSVSNPQQHISI
jgi:hypothetical protein